jgi:hypothetical protein
VQTLHIITFLVNNDIICINYFKESEYVIFGHFALIESAKAKDGWIRYNNIFIYSSSEERINIPRNKQN